MKISGVFRLPAAWAIVSAGVLLGFPLGRSLQDDARAERPSPERSLPRPEPEKSVSRSAGESPDPAARELMHQWAGWRETHGWVPAGMAAAAMALGGRDDVEEILEQLRLQRDGRVFCDLVLLAWADRDPEAACDYFVANAVTGRSLFAPCFLSRMAGRHWDLLAPYLEDPGADAWSPLARAARVAWAGRLRASLANPAAVRQLAVAAPESIRRDVLDGALELLAPDHPEEALKLLEAVPEDWLSQSRGHLAVCLARTHPEWALGLVDEFGLDRVYDSQWADDSSACDVLSAVARRCPAEAMAVLYRVSVARGQLDHREFARVAANFPRDWNAWLPDAVTAARNPGGAGFLRALIGSCPWGNEDSAAAVASLAGEMQAVAAEAWAARWAMAFPDEARQWAGSLPPVARARAQAAMWPRGTPPDSVLLACEEAGTIPETGVLTAMGREAPEVTTHWLAGQPGVIPGQLAAAALGWASADPAGAAGWAVSLPEPDTRVRVVSAVVDAWLMQDPHAAVVWLADPLLDDHTRARVTSLTGL